MRRQRVFLVCPGQKVSPAHHLTRKGSDKGRTPMNSKGEYKSPLVIISQWVNFARNFWRLPEFPSQQFLNTAFLKKNYDLLQNHFVMFVIDGKITVISICTTCQKG